MRKIPISLEKCWAESSLENYKSTVRTGRFLHDLLYGIPMVCQLDCFLHRAREVWNIFI